MKAIDLHSIAIIADWWLEAKVSSKEISAKAFEKEIKAAKELRKIASKMNDNDEVAIFTKPF